MQDDTDGASFASPPCFAHELALGPDGYVVMDADTARDVARWRKAERERLIASRLAVPAAERQRVAEEVAAELDRLIEPRPGVTVSLYWPFRGELDLREWMTRAAIRGASIALPIVVEKGQPLVFRAWHPGCRMERGVWNIPVPADGEQVIPDVTIAPVVGYDPASYRLGYGGGFFDRTLASFAARPQVIGVGHPCAAIPTIHPQPHDIPMDVIVTGAGRVQTRTDAR
ncbi:5-formyltetrahydrofolate cyclo-ligase [Limibaculum sp. M0105]|uniref:5-formyltetrahydrofolate cyclo-ligase n=1 Tax=Thermohalobaculum xanthum TaxID=2753746 RepID=A0A8J7M4R4_9RHOB|nr:5-formyltetrahydrofolate cyclo-ligase [Thermohalobaculum xanthum]MBK0398279.1 5-formyltetrahydrofolate cyclo-ligase [Thermohalobaculum xanthum]